MHIVFLTNEFPFDDQTHGGIGTFIKILSTKLVENEIRVSVVGITGHPAFHRTTPEGIELYNLEQSKVKFGKFIFNSLNIRKLLKKIQQQHPIDIVEGAELSFAFLARKTPYQKVIRMHGGHHFFAKTLGKETAFWRSFQERKSFKKVDALIAVSDYVGSKTTELLKLNMSYTTIYNLINLDLFVPQSKSEKKDNSIFFVGTVCKKKGVKELIDAFILVKEKQDDATLHIIGRDWVDEEFGSYSEYVQQFIPKKLKTSITFYGSVAYTELPNLLATAEICVYPSHSESFGLTLVEAMSLEKPVVASSIEPFKEILEQGESGILCNPFDTEELAGHIVELLQNPTLASALSKSARARVMSKFSTESIVKQNVEFYTSLI